MFYEQRPVIYAVAGVIGLLYARQSKLALVSGLVLLVCAGLVYYARKANRERNDIAQAGHDELSKHLENKNNNNNKISID